MQRINKYIIIIVLVITNIITLIALNNMSNRASYHMNDADKVFNVLEGILDRVFEDDSTYYLDVLVESQEYMEYEELKY